MKKRRWTQKEIDRIAEQDVKEFRSGYLSYKVIVFAETLKRIMTNDSKPTKF